MPAAALRRQSRWWTATAVAVTLLFFGPQQPLASTQRQLDFLTEAVIRAEIIGRKLDGVYVDGRSWKEDYAIDSRLEYADDLGPLTGHWHINGGVFCMTYEPQAATFCYLVRRAGANCYEFYDVPKDWTRRELPPDRKGGWTAKGGRSGEADGCFDPTV